MRKGVFALMVLGVMVMGTVAWAFDAYFADSNGNKITTIWEGRSFWVVVMIVSSASALPVSSSPTL